MVACLSSIRALFTRHDRSQKISDEAKGDEGKGRGVLNNRRTKPSAPLMRGLEVSTLGTGSEHRWSEEEGDGLTPCPALVHVPRGGQGQNEKRCSSRGEDVSELV